MSDKKKYSVKDNPMYYITWKDIGKKDRICLILLVVALILMLTLAVLSNIMNIPGWLIIIPCVLGVGLLVYDFSFFRNFMFMGSHTDEDE